MENKSRYLLLIVLCFNFLFCCSCHKKKKLPNLNNSSHETQSIIINTDIITVCIGNNLDLPCEGTNRHNVPVSINFLFTVKNNTDKLLLFGANTKNYYLQSEEFYYIDTNDGVLGYFLMINKEDSIKLFSDYINASVLDKERQYGASIDYIMSSKEHPEFINFLCKIPQAKEKYQKYIYDYIKESKFLYIPIKKDYERIVIQMESKEKKKYFYPSKTIYIHPLDSLIINFETCEQNNNRIEIYKGE